MDSSKAGLFQTIEKISDHEIIIRDQLYGDHTISEPALVELLQTPELNRLKGVCQHGVTGLLGLTPVVTRLEHSVGAFLLVRKVGASTAEQIAALLHDISHTTLSHVVDYALTKPGEDSFHEVHKERYLKMTSLPGVLIKHGFKDCQPLHEDFYPLVEMPAPHLCADRLDYALRDAVGFEKLPLEDVRRAFRDLKAFPDASSPGRLLVLSDADLALKLARAYLAADRDVWSNRAHADMYSRTGQLIKDMVSRGSIMEETLWMVSDKEFWELLRNAANPEELEIIKALEMDGLPDEEGLRLPQATKIRSIDPDVCVGGTAPPRPLSEVHEEWAIERKEYIAKRQMERG